MPIVLQLGFFFLLLAMKTRGTDSICNSTQAEHACPHSKLTFSEVTDSLTDLFLATPKNRWMQLSESNAKTQDVEGIEPFMDVVGVKQEVLDLALEQLGLARRHSRGKTQYKTTKAIWNSWFHELNIKGFKVFLDWSYKTRYICLSTMRSPKAPHSVKEKKRGFDCTNKAIKYGTIGLRTRLRVAEKSFALEECLVNAGFEVESTDTSEEARGDENERDAEERSVDEDSERNLEKTNKRSSDEVDAATEAEPVAKRVAYETLSFLSFHGEEQATPVDLSDETFVASLKQDVLKHWWDGMKGKLAGSKPGSAIASRARKALNFVVGNGRKVCMLAVPRITHMGRLNGEHRESLNDLFETIGGGDISSGALTVMHEAVRHVSDDELLKMIQTDRFFPKMDVYETLAMWVDVGLTHSQMLTVASHVYSKYKVWIFAPLAECKKPGEKYRCQMHFADTDVDAGEMKRKTNLQFWYTYLDEKVLKVLRQKVDEGKELGVEWGKGRGVYVCESDDHGNIAGRFGCTVSCCEGEGQGDFHMCGCLKGKDTYTNMCATISKPLEEGRRRLRSQVVVEVVSTNRSTGEVKRSVTLAPKTSKDFLQTKPLIDSGDGFVVGVYPTADINDKRTCLLEEKVPSLNCLIVVKMHDVYMLATGDLLFLSMMLGKEGMSTYWCPYCDHAKPDWAKARLDCDSSRLWTSAKLKVALAKFQDERRRGTNMHKGECGVKQCALWSYEPCDIVPPVLHLPLGLTSDLWDRFEEFSRSLLNCGLATHAEALQRIIEVKGKEVGKLTASTEEKQKLVVALEKERAQVEASLTKLRNAEGDEFVRQSERFACLGEMVTGIKKALRDEKRLLSSNAAELKRSREDFQVFEARQRFANDACYRALEDNLKTWRIERQAYMSRTFIGPHIRQLMRNAKHILKDICDELKQLCPVEKHAEIEKECRMVCAILLCLDAVSSFSKRATRLNQADLAALERKIAQLSCLWCKYGLSCTPKLHVVESHLLHFAKRLLCLGVFSEEAIERTHHQAVVLSKFTNVSDFKASSTQTENRKLQQSVGLVRAINSKIGAERKRSLTEEKVEEKAEREEKRRAEREAQHYKDIDVENVFDDCAVW